LLRIKYEKIKIAGQSITAMAGGGGAAAYVRTARTVVADALVRTET
jgi:hypothetical protein